VFHFHFPPFPQISPPLPLSLTIFPSSQMLVATTIATAGHTIQCLRSSVDHHVILMERRPEPSFSLSPKPQATIGRPPTETAQNSAMTPTKLHPRTATDNAHHSRTGRPNATHGTSKIRFL
jgi:hypothetical protein